MKTEGKIVKQRNANKYQMKGKTMKAGIRSLLIAVAAIAYIASPAQANIIEFTGSTAGGSTYNRPIEDLSIQSFVGINVAYSTANVNVNANGTYTFLTTAQFDSFAFLYANSFNPNTPLVNAIRGNDDLLPGFTTSGFAADLIAGTDYVYVTTGFGNTDYGAFSETIGGPGIVTVTPPTPASSSIFTFTGSTAGGSMYNRPLADLSGLSGVGTNVAYSAFDFGITASGQYTFLNTAGFDSFVFLYANSFDPTSPLTNAIIADDDLVPVPGFTTAGFATNLIAGTHYVFVTTGFDNTAFGAFSNTIGGPGALSTNPPTVAEPQPYLLLILGLAALGFTRRYQRSTIP